MTFSLGQTFLHASAASIMTFGFSRLHTLPIDNWMQTQYGGHFQFLTIQGLAIAWLTMIVGLLSNLYPDLQVFRNVKRALFIVALPLSVTISVVYWTLITLFPSLIIHPLSDSFIAIGSSSTDLVSFRIPLSIDLVLHASPAVALLMDFILYQTKYNEKTLRSVAPITNLAFTLWYGVWVEYCAKRNNGIFPYPFLTNNTFGIRLAIYAGASILAYTSFLGINSFHRRP